MKKEIDKPKVGVGVMLFKGQKLLLGKRKSEHGLGEYAWPGGHLEFGESFKDCAKREVKEETGMEIKNIKFVRLLNLKTYKDKHYVDIGLRADWKSGIPKVLEPDKVERWDWYDIKNLPKPLFGTMPTYLEAHKTGKIFFDN